MTRLIWTVPDLGTFGACNALVFLSPALLQEPVDRAEVAEVTPIPRTAFDQRMPVNLWVCRERRHRGCRRQ
jgi:hypothetical protein